MLRGLLSLALFGFVTCSNEMIKTMLVTKHGVTVESPNYPQPFSDGKNYGWAFFGYTANLMEVKCENLDIAESTDCADSYLLIRDGTTKKKFCGKRSDVTFTTRQFYTMIYFSPNQNQGSFKCTVKLTDPHPDWPVQEEYHFLEEHHIALIALQGKSDKTDIKTWVVNTTPDLKLKLYCKRFASGGPQMPSGSSCREDHVEIDLGEGKTTKHCSTKYGPTFNSQGNRLVVRVSRKSYNADIECVVTATNGKEEPYYKDVASEEVDSSEYGMKAGTKGTTCDCGRANKRPSTRVIFGTDAGENEFPWAVSLQTNTEWHFCGGSIVTPRHVITAAHCTQGMTADNTNVVVGISNLKKSPGRKSYPALRIINHDYQRTPTRRDIAVVITKDKIQYSSTVSPICLPKVDPKMVGKYITAVGWGQMAKNETMRDVYHLKKAHMRVVSPFDCNSIWSRQHHDTELSQICTFSRHRDICLGDSGGPVTWLDPETNRYFLVGLPSLCDGCVLSLPSIHTAVHWYHDWINKMISEHEYSDEKVCTKMD